MGFRVSRVFPRLPQLKPPSQKGDQWAQKGDHVSQLSQLPAKFETLKGGYLADHVSAGAPFGRVVLIGGADPRATQPENPTLAHLAQ